MKISFVIPAYNEEAVIGRCVEAILLACATAKLPKNEYEIIVVNNASADRTREIAAGFAGVRVVDEPHKGITWARQAGFRASRGALIANPDADTRMPRQWLTRVLQEFEQDPTLTALSGPYRYYDLPMYAQTLVQAYNSLAFATYVVNHHVLGVGSMIQGGNFVVRRAALEKIGGYNTSIEFYGEDADIATRISRVGKVKWSWQLYMYSSGRRFTEEGLVTAGTRYAINYLWTTFHGKAFTKTHLDIRTKQD
jgi:glycosyltransferase involved in cell wall biosynthesis